MNRSNDLIQYLAKADTPETLIVAPNAPPVVREPGGVRVAIATVFDAQDVSDTLAAMRTRAMTVAAESSMLAASGSFSFGIKELGRFRLSYATQRGSRIFTLVRIPYRIPAAADLVERPEELEKAAKVLVSGAPGLLAICGSSAVGNGMIAYALLNRVNEQARKVLYILERTLTFLMAHGNSIVVQCEVGADVPSFEAGLQNAFLLQPDVVYVGDERPGDELPSLRHAVENGAMALVSSVSLSEQALVERHASAHKAPSAYGRQAVKAAVRVAPGERGKWRVDFTEWLPEET